MSVQMATVLIYLTAPEEGGETVFPLEGEHGLDRLANIDYTSCKQGLKVCSRCSIGLLCLSLPVLEFSQSQLANVLLSTDYLSEVPFRSASPMH